MTGQLPWLPSMNVGIATVDDDHRRLLGLITALSGHVEAVNVADAHASATILLAELDRHFASEEALMRQHHYPEAESHVARHAASRVMALRVVEYAKSADTIGRAGPLVQELCGSFFRNLLQEDGALAEWLLMRGMRT